MSALDPPTDIPDRFPPIEEDRLSAALCGEIVLAYSPTDIPGVFMVYSDGRVIRFHITPDNELAVQFNRLPATQ